MLKITEIRVVRLVTQNGTVRVSACTGEIVAPFIGFVVIQLQHADY